MKVTQISVFLENKSGRLAKLASILAEEKVNIRALSIADTSDFGILRLILDDPEKGFSVLKSAGFAVNRTSVICIKVPDHPGGLAGILKVVEAEHFNIEYMYAFVEKSEDNALVIVSLDRIDEAIEVLQKNGIIVMPAKQVYKI
ncbi:MAG: ACT domain-containing protein [Limnochordia bacterium]|jgi:hypothetical protein|nr:ACT domain-containing protein [Limnochordia bacterium]MDD2630194.1 ACT domain-containing protein [Limnochordia bacterium]MDD4517331.1 ACT domain-containing protein [Limnochordia bacterium]